MENRMMFFKAQEKGTLPQLHVSSGEKGIPFLMESGQVMKK
jgi:hypothetical protein